MTKDEAKKHKQFLLHHSEGTPLQVWSKRDLCWYDSPNPSFRLNCIYRVKPVETEEERSMKACRESINWLHNCSDSFLKQSGGFAVWEAARKYYQANKD